MKARNKGVSLSEIQFYEVWFIKGTVFKDELPPVY